MPLVARDLIKNERFAGEREDYGWEAAVNLITPLPATKLLKRFLVLWILRRAWRVNLLRRFGLLQIRPVEEQLRRLNHLHYARWSIVWRFPRPGGAAKEAWRGPRLLLFTSHFDAGWRRYLGSFIETTGDGLANLWGDTPSWRNPSDGAREFENFVVDQQVPHGHLFAAFPQMSCNDVRAAVRLNYEIEAHNKTEALNRWLGVWKTKRQKESHKERRDRALLRRVQYCLGRLHDRPYSGLAAEQFVERDPDPHGFTCIVPYPHERTQKLTDALGALPVGEHSPFAKLPGTHFARLAMIGEDHYLERSVPALANGYLLLSCEIDGFVDEWLRALSRLEELDPVWRLCHGYDDPGSLPRWLLSCRIKPTLEYIDYPSLTVHELAAAAENVKRGASALVGPPLFEEDTT